MTAPPRAQRLGNHRLIARQRDRHLETYGRPNGGGLETLAELRSNQ